jgi:hypothetical protein
MNEEQTVDNPVPDERRVKYPITDEMLARLDQDFTYHAPHNDQPARYEALRRAAKELARMIVTSTPPSREQSLALTNLEQSIFWANASIARHEKEEPEERRW